MKLELRDLIEYFLVEGEDVDDFGEWAFGEGFGELSGAQVFLGKWFELHGDELKISPNGMPVRDIPKMVDLWREKR